MKGNGKEIDLGVIDTVEGDVEVAVGDALTCWSVGALSYRWTSVHNDSYSVTYGNTVMLSRPGFFSYECTVFVDSGTGVICAFSKNLTGFATIALGINGYVYFLLHAAAWHNTHTHTHARTHTHTHTHTKEHRQTRSSQYSALLRTGAE